jgi:hypothetical protein
VLGSTRPSCLLVIVGLCAACSGDDSAAVETKGPDPQCSGCYVVNATITANASALFIGGYMGENLSGFVRHYADGAWGTIIESDQLGAVSSLWADQHALFIAASGGMRRIELDGFKGESFDVGGGRLWGSASDDVFALDEGLVHHFDGDAWQDAALDLGSPRALTGSSANDVYALDHDGKLAHFDGHAWAALPIQPPAPPLDLWSMTAHDLLAVSGDDTGDRNTTGRIMRYDGERWKVLHEAPGDALLGVAAASDRLVYAVGGSRRNDRVDPIVWRFDGTEFTRHVLPGDAFLWDVFCAARGACHAVGTDNMFVDLGRL